MSLITEYESTKTIPVQIHVVDTNNMIGYSVSDSIPCATDNVIPNNAFIMYLTDIQKSHNAEYSFAISYDEHTCEATELKSIPMTDTRFSQNVSGVAYNTSMLVIVLKQQVEKKNNIANSTRRNHCNHRNHPKRSNGTRKCGY